jgi:hypothetical protein
MTPVRSKRGKWVHWFLGPKTLCGRPLKAPIVEPDAQPDCPECVAIATTN